MVWYPAQNRGRPALKSFAVRVLVSLSALFATAPASAGEFTIYQADTELVDKVYRLTANLDYKFSERVLEAINSGVPVVLLMELELYKVRDYIWDKEIASLQQRYRLQYHVLSEQYIVTNLNSGAQLVYPSLYSATASIRSLKNIPIIDARLIELGKPYVGRLRASLELSSLPVPLRLNAYFSGKWRLKSDWYEWSLVRYEPTRKPEQEQEQER